MSKDFYKEGFRLAYVVNVHVPMFYKAPISNTCLIEKVLKNEEMLRKCFILLIRYCELRGRQLTVMTTEGPRIGNKVIVCCA